MFDYDTLKEAYDYWVTNIYSKAPASRLLYEIYNYSKVASVPVTATAYANRTKVRMTLLAYVILTNSFFY